MLELGCILLVKRIKVRNVESNVETHPIDVNEFPMVDDKSGSNVKTRQKKQSKKKRSNDIYRTIDFMAFFVSVTSFFVSVTSVLISFFGAVRPKCTVHPVKIIVNIIMMIEVFI